MTVATPGPMDDLSQPQRQSPVAIVADLFNINALQGLIPFVLFGLGQGVLVLIGLLLLGVVLMALFSGLGWHFTKYWIDNDNLVLEKGVFNRKRTQVPLDRIQQIATEQGVVQQMFGVRKVRVDSAGSAGSEVQLSAITDEKVAQLRSYLVGADRIGHAAPPMATPGAQAAADGTPLAPLSPMPGAVPPGSMIPQEDRRTMVLRHELRDLAQVAVARPSPQVVAGVIAVMSLGVGGLIERVFENATLGVVATVVLGLLALAALVLFMIAGTVLREFDLTVWRSDQGLRLTAGLLNKRELFARTERVQYVQRKQNLLERWLSRTAVHLPQASSVAVATGGTATQAFWVPGVPDDKLGDITDLFLPAGRPEPMHPIAAKARFRWFLWEGLVPAVGLTVLGLALFLFVDPRFVALIVWAVALGIGAWGYFVAKVTYRNYRWNVNEHAISTTEGFISRERLDVACRKLQSVRLKQGWWHRRHNLATVQCGTAAGSFTIQHLPEPVARQLRDELLYLVETSTEDWM